jgi:hypothetical protein
VYGSTSHLICDDKGLPIAVAVTTGQRHESTQFEAVIGPVCVRRKRGRPHRRPRGLAADKGYCHPHIRRHLRRRGIRR